MSQSGKRGAEDAKANREGGDDELVVPDALVKAIREGTCVAFVGAGFSMAERSLPGWGALIEGILKEASLQEKIPEEVKKEVERMIKENRFEHAAQVLEDKCGSQFVAEVSGDMLKPPEKLCPAMTERITSLFSIPFNSILTTNFDYFLAGPPAAHESAKPFMREILRGSPLTMVEQMIRDIQITAPYLSELFDEDEVGEEKFNKINQSMAEGGADFQDEDEGQDDEESDDDIDIDTAIPPLPIIQLHGTVVPKDYDEHLTSDAVRKLFASWDYRADPGLAFTQLGYRRLVQGNPTYTKFLSSVMSTKTILYIGLSFSDAYINEIRSQTMMTLQQQQKPKVDDDDEEGPVASIPIGYAISTNKPATEIELFGKHEGIHFLNYIPADGGNGFDGVEKWLVAIRNRTSPLYRWSRCLKGKKILIFANGNLQGIIRMVHLLAEKYNGHELGEVVVADLPESGTEFTEDNMQMLMQEAGAFDVILVGHVVNGIPAAEYMLSAMDFMGKDGNNSPVLVLDRSPKSKHSENKKKYLKRGAAGYVSNMRSCFEEILHVLEKPAPPEKWEKDACSIS